MANSSGSCLPHLNKTVEQTSVPGLNKPFLPDMSNLPPSPFPSFSNVQVTSINRLEDAVAGSSSAGPSSRVEGGARRSNSGIGNKAPPYPPEVASIVEQGVNTARICGHENVTTVHVAKVIFCCSSGLLLPPCRSRPHSIQCNDLMLAFSNELTKINFAYNPDHQLTYSPALKAAFNRAKAEMHQQPLPKQPYLLALVNSFLDDPTIGRIMTRCHYPIPWVKEKVRQALSNI